MVASAPRKPPFRPRAYTGYRGLPVACEATVVYADTGQVTFKVNRYQWDVLSRSEFALIRSPLLGMTFRAYLNRVNVDSQLASFTLFECRGEGAERRGNVRLQPLEDNTVTKRLGQTSVVGQLLDISASAIAAFVTDADPAVLQAGKPTRLKLSARGAGTFSLEANGHIHRVLAWAGDHPNDFRIVFKLELEAKDRAAIEHYVAEQQMRVLREMNQ